jgi:outer membrane murein-binding lipoprotein Lpp
MPALTLLSVSPSETLVFSKMSNANTPSETLKLTNDSQENVAFKVKTTAPKSYMVRPSFGTLRPQETQEVQIILVSTDAMSVSEHRFLVQAVPSISSTEAISKDQWKAFSPDMIQSTKLNVRVEEGALGSASGSITSDVKRDVDDVNARHSQLEKERNTLKQDIRKLEQTLAEAKSKQNPGAPSLLHMVIVASLTLGLLVALDYLMKHYA